MCPIVIWQKISLWLLQLSLVSPTSIPTTTPQYKCLKKPSVESGLANITLAWEGSDRQLASPTLVSLGSSVYMFSSPLGPEGGGHL